MPLKYHKQALIITYIDNEFTETLDKPFRVMVENVNTAIKSQQNKFAHLIKKGVPVKVEYDLLHFTKKTTI